MSNSSENTNYLVVIGVEAQKFFEASPASLQKKLDRCFEQLKINPHYHPNIKL